MDGGVRELACLRCSGCTSSPDRLEADWILREMLAVVIVAVEGRSGDGVPIYLIWWARDLDDPTVRLGRSLARRRCLSVESCLGWVDWVWIRVWRWS